MIKRIFKGALILAGTIIVASGILAVGCTMMASKTVDVVDESLQEYEQYQDNNKAIAQAVVDEIEWTKEGDYLVGYFKNPLEEEIDYLEIEYKFKDANGVIIDSSFTNVSYIGAGEVAKIEIDTCLAEGYASYEITVSEANCYQE